MSEEPESPVETPEPETPEEEVPTPEESKPETEEGEPVEAVEPTLGLKDFLAVHPMRDAAAAMLARWLTREGKDSAGHYTQAEWEGYHQEMLKAT